MPIPSELKENIIEQLDNQEKLNNETCGLNWESGITKDGKIIDWRLEMCIEASELSDSTPHKHWKDIKKPVNYININIELVDIWHFILSQLLSKKLAKCKIADIIVSEMNFANNENYKKPIEEKYYIQDINKYVMKFKAQAADIDRDFIKTKAIRNFFILCKVCELDINKLFSLYFGKNYLNEFRQLNGYKEGNYIKIWDKAKKQEDNEFMYELVFTNETLTKDAFMKTFKYKYLHVKELEEIENAS